MFGTEVVRLLREKWPNPTMLAEELFAILSPNIPLTHDAPLTINNDTPGPALTINNNGGSTTTIQFNDNGNPAGSITINEGNVTFGEPDIDAPSTGGGGGSVTGRDAFVGTVTGGTGASYTVTLDNGDSVGVTVPGIVATETIPTGSAAVVIKLDNGSYQMIFPLWIV